MWDFLHKGGPSSLSLQFLFYMICSHMDQTHPWGLVAWLYCWSCCTVVNCSETLGSSTLQRSSRLSFKVFSIYYSISPPHLNQLSPVEGGKNAGSAYDMWSEVLNVMVHYPLPKPPTTSSFSSPTLSQPPTSPYICKCPSFIHSLSEEGGGGCKH